MVKIQIIDSNQSYTFTDYFKLNYEPDEIIGYFGYKFQSQSLTLPTTQQNLERLTVSPQYIGVRSYSGIHEQAK